MRQYVNKFSLHWPEAKTRRFRRQLLAWYLTHKRDLPWRESHDPYRVWLSEIMLQQTRVAAVIDYYSRFLRRFPSVGRLAAAREESVLAAWSGLGYYRRARMLHAAAKVIVKEHGGKFPGTRESLGELPGIGRYTSAAIASIAFNEPVAVVDGNVERVLQRVAGPALAGEDLWQTAGILLERANPGDFNQAMMELGALVCLPAQPECRACPVRALCATRGAHPVQKKFARKRKRDITFALACRKGSVLLVQRPMSNPLMPGMWELPEPATNQVGEALLVLRHSITVTDYKVRVVEAVFPYQIAGKWVANKRVSRLPLTGLTKKILRAMNIV